VRPGVIIERTRAGGLFVDVEYPRSRRSRFNADEVFFIANAVRGRILHGNAPSAVCNFNGDVDDFIGLAVRLAVCDETVGDECSEQIGGDGVEIGVERVDGGVLIRSMARNGSGC